MTNLLEYPLPMKIRLYSWGNGVIPSLPDEKLFNHALSDAGYKDDLLRLSLRNKGVVLKVDEDKYEIKSSSVLSSFMNFVYLLKVKSVLEKCVIPGSSAVDYGVLISMIKETLENGSKNFNQVSDDDTLELLALTKHLLETGSLGQTVVK